MRLVAATRNWAKIAALQTLVGERWRVEPLPNDISPEIAHELDREQGSTCQEIARAKVIAGSGAVESGDFVIASDGGLLIPALRDRWDPIGTRRFAGPHADDQERARQLLELTSHLRGEQRRIQWFEAVAIASNGGLLAEWDAVSADGVLAERADEPTLAHSIGFWIDAVWCYPAFDGRFRRELSLEEGLRIDDHWSRLARPVRAWLDDR